MMRARATRVTRARGKSFFFSSTSVHTDKGGERVCVRIKHINHINHINHNKHTDT